MFFQGIVDISKKVNFCEKLDLLYKTIPNNEGHLAQKYKKVIMTEWLEAMLIVKC